MSVKINWALNVQVDGGPSLAASDAIEVDAYDIIEVNVPKQNNGTDGKATVKVAPGGAADVLFLLIKSDVYKNAPVSYKVDGGTKTVKLDSQQTLIGAGATGLLEAAPNKLVFTNNGQADANVRILVGRKAV
jgi:hypothetical protein